MIHPTLHSTVRFSRISVAAILLLLAVPLRTMAGVAVGPILTNAAEAEQHRIMLSNEAQRSMQRKLEVGKERYEQRQAQRASAIKAMSVELEKRRAMIVIQPAAAPIDKGYADTSSWSWLLLGVAALGAGFMGLRHYQKRQNQ